MLYTEPKVVPNSLNDRTVTARNIDDCRDQKFVESHCIRPEGKPHGLQSWSITCSNQAGVDLPPRTGYCNADEVCINSVPSTRSLGEARLMAKCISQHSFNRIASGESIDSSLDEEGILEAWDSMMMGMVVSMTDGSTPMEVDTFDIEAGINPDGTARQSKTCRDCMDLQTDKFAAGTKLLDVQTKLMSAGLGMLWLAATVSG